MAVKGGMAVKKYSSGKIDQVRIETLRDSMDAVGQVYPVLKNLRGEVIDGFHRKRVDPNWKEMVLPVDDPIETLRLMIHLNLIRRKVGKEEKEGWITDCRSLLQERGLKGTQEEIHKAMKISQPWVSKYDLEPVQPNKPHSPKVLRRDTFYSVWGFRDDSWRQLILKAEQPRYEFYHGITPAFVIENLLELYRPQLVLDSMAGIGTTKWVCQQHEIECDQFDIYPFPNGGVKEGDAEHVETGKTYDIIFNHIPYLDMVEYGDDQQDLSRMTLEKFYEKLSRIFRKNHELLNDDGIYAILVGDRRKDRAIIPLTAKTTQIGLETGFKLYDEAIKLTGEAQSTSGLLQYRAAEFNFMIPCHDTVLIFKRD